MKWNHFSKTHLVEPIKKWQADLWLHCQNQNMCQATRLLNSPLWSKKVSDFQNQIGQLTANRRFSTPIWWKVDFHWNWKEQFVTHGWCLAGFTPLISNLWETPFNTLWKHQAENSSQTTDIKPQDLEMQQVRNGEEKCTTQNSAVFTSIQCLQSTVQSFLTTSF